MQADLLIHSASQLLTLTSGPQRGSQLGDLGIIRDGAIAISGKTILATGTTAELQSNFRSARSIDARGKVVMPGLVDPHTHLLWVGDRAAEFEMRIAGASYMQIMATGGGIVSTVRQTRAANIHQMMEETLPRLHNMLSHGTTTAEAKTGYGLETQTELRMLEAILRLDESCPIDLIPTFLGAHAIPPEYTDHPEAYANLIGEEMLPAVRSWWEKNGGNRPLPFVDVFCEEGAFNLAQSRKILETAKRLGFGLKIHSDEFKSIGGTSLAVELGAVSADHLVRASAADIQALGQSDTVAVALPCTPFGLAEDAYTPARQIIQADGFLALATDLNPGTAWCESMQFAIALACRYMRLTPKQAIAAATINAAFAIRKDDQIGSLRPGKQADILILQAPDYRHLGYRFGGNLVDTVIKSGDILEIKN